jgi:XRE family aerobic/anaerobic benzoate catabolism transcriptional regulator
VAPADPQPGAEQLARVLGRRVRALRVARALTVKDLAARSGLSPRLLALVEAGQANPTLSSMADLAAALGATVTALLTDDVPAARAVALLGLRGAGKSTIGAALGDVLGWPFIELDRQIERESGLSLSTLFELHGEDHVRHLEARVVGELLSSARPAVMACGGGVVTAKDSFAALRARTLTVWLKATPQEHWDRVRAQGDERPMARRSGARAELDALWHARRPLYALAELHVDTSALSVDEAVAVIASAANGDQPR